MVQRDYRSTQADSQKDGNTIDSWYTGNEVISNCRKRGYGWIGDLKPNRVIIYDGKRMNVSNLMNILRKRGQFTYTVIDGQIYQTVKVMAYIPSLRENVSIVINAKADTKDVRVRCNLPSGRRINNLQVCEEEGDDRKLLQGCKEGLRVWRYRFRKSEGALRARAPKSFWPTPSCKFSDTGYFCTR